MSQESYDDRQGAAAYEAHAANSAYNAHYDRPAVLRLAGDVEGLLVLDAACGPGFYASELLARGARVVGFDRSNPMLHLAQRRLGSAVPLLRCGLEAPLPFTDETFDLVVCALAIHYVPDRTETLTEVQRVLRPDSALVLSTQHPTTDWIRKGGSYFDIKQETDIWKRNGDDWPMTFWREPVSSLTEAAHRAGFLIERFIEPMPEESMREVDLEEYEKLKTRPGFLLLRLIKRP